MKHRKPAKIGRRAFRNVKLFRGEAQNLALSAYHTQKSVKSCGRAIDNCIGDLDINRPTRGHAISILKYMRRTDRTEQANA